ncbi:MAG TPA: hypothetical protein PLZ43_14015 [bacterium]|nr:hypothetical protein [bacterium]
MRKYLILLALFVPLFVFADNTPQVNEIVNSSRLYRTSFYLYAGSQYKFRTYSSTEDTVIHVLNSSNVQVAWNDDCGSDCATEQASINSTVTYTPTVSGTYYGVMRHYYNGRVGKIATIKAYRDGTLVSTQTDRPVGGYKVLINPWSAYTNGAPNYNSRKVSFYYFNRSKEETGGATIDDTSIYLMSNTNTITDFNDDGGANLSAKILKTSGSCSTSCYILGGAYPFSPQSEGNARSIVDVNFYVGVMPQSDWDFDGLSDSLESLLGTQYKIVDSDEDGLNDYIETLGTADILLPWEGSSPVEQDIFAEVDYFGKMLPAPYNYFTYFYKDFEADIETRLRNSFNLHGDIRFHVDVDDYLGEMADNKPLKYSECGTGGDADTFYIEDERANHFTSARTGIYTWVVAANKGKLYPDSGGRSCAGYNDPAFMITAGFHDGGGNLNRYTGTTIHEYGHIFGLGHNGNDNSTAALNSTLFRSVMNYSYQNAGVPVNVAGDSAWRYSTDSSTTRAGLVWQDTIPANVSPNYHTIAYAPFSCANSATSPKKYCVDHRTNPYCDCTYEEWTHLDLTGGGIMGLGEGGEETEMEDLEERAESPVFGRNGKIIASNLEELMSSGEKFTKVTKESEKKEYLEELKKKNEEFWTVEKKKARMENYLKKLEEKGLKEGEDYEIINGEISFK